MGMGLREYARHRGVAPSAVSKALASGRIARDPDGTIDPVKADAAWERNTNPAQQQNPAPKQPTPAHPVQSHQAPKSSGETGAANVTAPSYQISRAVREAYNAKMARLDYEERVGRLLKAEEVATEAYQTARRVRDRLFGIPRRLAAVLASETDAKSIERLLENELRIALEELSSSERSGQANP